MDKKAQIEGLQTFLLIFVGVAITLTVGLIVLAELQTAAAPATYWAEIDNDPVTVNTFNGLITNTYVYNLSVPDIYSRVKSVDWIYPRTNFTKEITENYTLIHGAKLQLTYRNWHTSQVEVYNATNSGISLGASNYTINNTGGDITWALGSLEMDVWNNTMVFIHYNKTFAALEDDLTEVSTYCNSGRTTTCTTAAHYSTSLLTYNTASGLRVTNNYFNQTSWTVTYTTTTNTLISPTNTASNATGSVITKLATIPTWAGIIIVVALAFIILAFFYRRGQVM